MGCRYHRVSSVGREPTISLNFWHDMEFIGPGYVYYRLARAVAGLDAPAGEEAEAGPEELQGSVGAADPGGTT